MKRFEKTLAIASSCLVIPLFACPAFAQNSYTSNSSDTTTTASQSATLSPAARQEAQSMVPAQAALLQDLDATNMKPGSLFKARLSEPAKLDNGTMLPKGTTLMGQVTQDQSYPNAQSTLALQFSQAQLKDGKTIPIKATIVGIARPEEQNPLGYPVAPGDQIHNSWTDQTLQVDQVGVLPGVDLHSRIAGMNSGVLVATKQHSVKLDRGSEIELAIAPQSQQPGV